MSSKLIVLLCICVMLIVKGFNLPKNFSSKCKVIMKVGDPIFCVNVNLYIKPERKDEFLSVIKKNQLGTLTNEPLAIQYTWGQSVDDPNTFYFHEQYHGKEGFEAHQKSSHFAVWAEFTKTSPFSKPPVVTLWEEIPGTLPSRKQG